MLLSTKAEVQQTMLLADALGMTVKNKRAVTAFLAVKKQKQMPYEAKGEYEFQSGGIIDTLKDLQGKFQARKDELDSQETKAQEAFSAAAGAKREEIETDKTSLATDEDSLSQAESDIATTTEELTEEKAQLNDNELYLKDITGQCETKAKEWDQRSKAREGELTALGKAIEILGGTVLEKETATGAGGRGEPAGESAPPTEEGPPMELGPKGEVFPGLLQAGKAAAAVDSEEYQDVVFLQLGSVQTQRATEPELKRRAIAQLSKAAKDQKSVALAALVTQLKADPFLKVKGLIQQLIERLLEEATNEATHKGWCDTEMGKAEKDREFRQADTEKINAMVTDGEAQIASLKETITTLTEELAELNTALVDATTNRQDDKANNKKTLADAKEGLTALTQAIKVLEDYYKGAAKSKNRYEGGGYEGALLQGKASPVSADMEAEGVEGGELGAYAGNTEAAGGILGMLATIKSDFMRTIETTEKEEYAASRTFAAFSQETKASISSKETGKAQAEADLDRASAGLIASLTDLKDTQALLDKTLEGLEKLRPACVDTGMSYEERVERRQAEIDALKQALEVLSEGDGAFLQKKK
jgi:DNA repair exonuclease SbcCD ATPase subunit